MASALTELVAHIREHCLLAPVSKDNRDRCIALMKAAGLNEQDVATLVVDMQQYL